MIDQGQGYTVSAESKDQGVATEAPEWLGDAG